jgi:diguanylate cyclase (GGDEF)-like protein
MYYSKLSVIGRYGEDEFKDFTDMATKKITLVDNEDVELAINIMFPKAQVLKTDSALEAAQHVLDGISDYALMDIYEFQYLSMSDDIDGLMVLGDYNKNNDRGLYSIKEESVILFNEAINGVDEEWIFNQGVAEIVEFNNRSVEVFLLNSMLVLLVIALVFTVLRVMIFRNREKQLEYLSTHDSTTGALNLRGVKKQLMQLSKSKHKQFTLVLMDIMHFKMINSEFSYQHGDKVLMSISKFIEASVSGIGYSGRITGDEFVLVLEKELAVEETVDKLYVTINQYVKEISEIGLETVMGISTFIGSEAIEDAFTKAENAMYHQKEITGHGYSFYSKELERTFEEVNELTKDVKKAFEKNEFELFYQPQYNVDGEVLLGLEGLIRWNHYKKGMIGPYKFLPIIRKENLIKRLDCYVVEHGLKQIRQWIDSGHNICKVAYNISTISLIDPDFLLILRQLMEQYNIPKGKLCLEITEDFEVVEISQFESIIKKVKEMGVLIALDDFGTGFSSLSYLIRYPIDIIKIDKTLISIISNHAIIIQPN